MFSLWLNIQRFKTGHHSLHSLPNSSMICIWAELNVRKAEPFTLCSMSLLCIFTASLFSDSISMLSIFRNPSGILKFAVKYSDNFWKLYEFLLYNLFFTCSNTIAPETGQISSSTMFPPGFEENRCFEPARGGVRGDRGEMFIKAFSIKGSLQRRS